jgi:hypothetical protein
MEGPAHDGELAACAELLGAGELARRLDHSAPRQEPRGSWRASEGSRDLECGDAALIVNDEAAEAAQTAFIARGGATDRLLTILTSSGDDLSILGRIYCNAERADGEGDDSLRLRCLENWRPS